MYKRQRFDRTEVDLRFGSLLVEAKLTESDFQSRSAATVSYTHLRPAVKLSDNESKAMGDASEVERYRRVFGVAGLADIPVLT